MKYRPWRWKWIILCKLSVLTYQFTLADSQTCKQVDIIWISGLVTANFDGNEQAKKGSGLTIADGSEPALGITSTARRTQVKARIHKIHLSDYRQAKMFKMSKHFS